MRNCNLCKHINMTEKQQHEKAPGEPHICQKYRKRVFHRSNRLGYHEMIFPCKECVENEQKGQIDGET